MLGRLARGAYMLAIVVMIAAWAISTGKSSPAEPANEQQIEIWYC